MQKANFIVTGDGSHSLVTNDTGISYHSRHGAIQESNHVFIEAALRYKSTSPSPLRILEIGFGTGLNVFLSYLETMNTSISIDLSTYELYPIDVDQASLLNYSEILEAKDQQSIFMELHQCKWQEKVVISPNFSLTKIQKSFLEISYQHEFDVVFFDPFAPNDQPQFWDTSFLKKIYNSLAPGGVLTTYCAKGVVKRNLKEVGFKIESLPGPPGKREMTRATVLGANQSK